MAIARVEIPPSSFLIKKLLYANCILKSDRSLEKYVFSPAAASLQAKDGWSEGLARIFSGLVRSAGVFSLLLLIWLGWIVWQEARPAIEKFELGFLFSQVWNVDDTKFGAAPYIYGTLVTAILALLLAVPGGIAVAVITSEANLLSPRWRNLLAFGLESIAAIPSVIIGLWGIYVLIPAIKPLQGWLYKNFSQVPFFSTDPSGPSLLVAGIVLGIMILPTIAAISRDILLTVPQELGSASLALGATHWETILKVKLPVAAAGIIGAVMLGLGRALGETMAVTMVIGNSAQINLSLLDPAYTIPAVLANEFAEALDPLHIGALMYLALVLFVLTLMVNGLALLLVRLVRK
jgi:phosphate transport system permease protein